MCIKSEVEEILSKLATSDLPVDITILALMGCLPLLKGYV